MGAGRTRSQQGDTPGPHLPLRQMVRLMPAVICEQQGCLYARLDDELASLRAECDALHRDLRSVAIRHRGSIWSDHAALPAKGCDLCGERWIADYEPEQHAPGCR